MSVPSGVLAVFEHIDSAVDSVKDLRKQGHSDLTVYSPVPNHELEDAIGNKISPVRLWTLIGGLTGCASGYAMTMWMSYDYPIVVGGKAFGSFPPYVVIMFELTILFGALATIAGLVVNTILTNQKAPYDPRFSDDMIGVFVPCSGEKSASVKQMLEGHGAKEVKVEA